MLLWDRLKTLQNDFMLDAVNEFIANRRSCPVLNDFLDFQEIFKNRKRQDQAYNLPPESIVDFLKSKVGYAPNKPFAKKCLDLLSRYRSKKMNREEFMAHCDLLDAEAGENARRCKLCEGLGIVFKQKTGGRFSFACSCPLGNQHNALPMWDEVIHG